MMLQTSSDRNQERERWEQHRYAVLEQLYLIAGEDCGQAVSAEEIEMELDSAAALPMPLIEDLVRLGYLSYASVGTQNQVCITVKGIEYLQRDAWRRRSIRD